MNISNKNYKHIKTNRVSVSKTYKFFTIFIISLLFGCASTSTVLSDFDETIDFENYNTFVLCIDDLFVENIKYPKSDNNTIRQLIGDQIELHMINTGHKTNVLNPQLQAGFKIVIEQKANTFTNCEIQDDYNYWRECTIKTVTYNEETLVVYVSDIEKNQIIWQASKTCDLNRSKKAIKPYLEELVESLFNEYPKINY